MAASYGTIEPVRGRLTRELADELVDFWLSEGALAEPDARARVAEVVCALRDGSGAISAVSSVYPRRVDVVGGREFWIYRSYLAAGAGDAWRALAQRAFFALQAEHDPALEGPIGICHLVADDAEVGASRLAEWAFPASTYAGYVRGHQLRIHYFAGARVGAPRERREALLTPDRGYRVMPFRDQDEVTPEGVIDFWAREGAMPEDEASRRVTEVVAVATHDGAEPVGVATAYLQHNDQLGMDMWYFRAFVAAEHRTGDVARALTLVARDHLEQRFVGGLETRAAGIVMEVEHEGLKRQMDYAYWDTSGFTFIGENLRGAHVRVYYFPGALVPGPPA